MIAPRQCRTSKLRSDSGKWEWAWLGRCASRRARGTTEVRPHFHYLPRSIRGSPWRCPRPNPIRRWNGPREQSRSRS